MSASILILLVTPFYLNDLANMYVADWRAWLLIDYVTVKLFPLLLIGWLIGSRKCSPADLGLTRPRPATFLFVFIVVTLAGVLIDQNGYALLAGLPGYGALGGMPPITNNAWNWIDLTAGLALVAIVEELVFRGCMLSIIRCYTKSSLMIIATSSLAFGLIHWSLGLHAVLITALIGAVFMIAYLKTRSLWAIMLAHFAINFIDFSGLVPKSIFKLM